jgi:hypothetical protein
VPQILVVADSPGEESGAIVYRERIASSDLESDHFSGQLVERVSWAVQDADQIERTTSETGQSPVRQAAASATSIRPSSAAARSAS